MMNFRSDSNDNNCLTEEVFRAVPGFPVRSTEFPAMICRVIRYQPFRPMVLHFGEPPDNRIIRGVWPSHFVRRPPNPYLLYSPQNADCVMICCLNSEMLAKQINLANSFPQSPLIISLAMSLGSER
jgi:hypothetical protein